MSLDVVICPGLRPQCQDHMNWRPSTANLIWGSSSIGTRFGALPKSCQEARATGLQDKSPGNRDLAETDHVISCLKRLYESSMLTHGLS